LPLKWVMPSASCRPWWAEWVAGVENHPLQDPHQRLGSPPAEQVGIPGDTGVGADDHQHLDGHIEHIDVDEAPVEQKTGVPEAGHEGVVNQVVAVHDPDGEVGGRMVRPV
jgi:hypothetical protein